MPRIPFAIGDHVVAQVDKPMWYSDYGGRPAHRIQVGDIGEVVSIDIPPVRGPRITGKTKVLFGWIPTVDGKHLSAVEQSYFPEELRLEKREES